MELGAIMAKCRGEWHNVFNHGSDQRRSLWRGAAIQRIQLGSLASVTEVEAASEAVGLWGTRAGALRVPVASIVEEFKAVPSEQRSRRALHDPTLEVLMPQPRCAMRKRKPNHDPLLFGCSAGKKTRC